MHKYIKKVFNSYYLCMKRLMFIRSFLTHFCEGSPHAKKRTELFHLMIPEKHFPILSCIYH